ncbi:MAG: DUF2062 domain-containing protein [Spirochaetes bacterium]|nr:DUF2062 domain-containing protein [Spirochaetota bacterium]
MIKKTKTIWADIKKIFRALSSSRFSPEYIARSVAVGAFIALTPTFGFQMAIVGLVWSVFKFSGRWRFNLPIAISLTWLTNYFTIVPYYFICYYTGIWLGDYVFRFKSAMSYDRFSDLWQKVLDAGFWDSIVEFGNLMLKTGKPIFIGSLPYAIIGTIVLYKITRYSIIRHRRKVEQRMLTHARPVLHFETRDDIASGE